MVQIRRLDMGYFVRPGSETRSGEPRVEPVFGYLVRHDRGNLLFDSGIADAGPETDAHYRPTRRDLAGALHDAGLSVIDVTVLANCHLHFDHCGGNPLFAGVPILVQRRELAVARAGSYTVPELVDFTGVRYDEVDGEAEIWPGVRVRANAGSYGRASVTGRRAGRRDGCARRAGA